LFFRYGVQERNFWCLTCPLFLPLDLLIAARPLSRHVVRQPALPVPSMDLPFETRLRKAAPPTSFLSPRLVVFFSSNDVRVNWHFLRRAFFSSVFSVIFSAVFSWGRVSSFGPAEKGLSWTTSCTRQGRPFFWLLLPWLSVYEIPVSFLSY